MHSPDAEHWIGFSRVDGIGPSKTKRLLERFGSLAAAWRSSPEALVEAGIDFRTAQAFAQLRSGANLSGELLKLDRLGVTAICWDDPRYPKLLRHVTSPPMVLYVRGELQQDDVAVAIVGTRQPSAYGRQVAQKLAGELAAQGVTIVSGLARGIDGEAHRAALAANGRTLAVLGSGLDVIYPREHTGLAREISGHGR